MKSLKSIGSVRAWKASWNHPPCQKHCTAVSLLFLYSESISSQAPAPPSTHLAIHEVLPVQNPSIGSKHSATRCCISTTWPEHLAAPSVAVRALNHGGKMPENLPASSLKSPSFQQFRQVSWVGRQAEICTPQGLLHKRSDRITRNQIPSTYIRPETCHIQRKASSWA